MLTQKLFLNGVNQILCRVMKPHMSVVAGNWIVSAWGTNVNHNTSAGFCSQHHCAHIETDGRQADSRDKQTPKERAVWSACRESDGFTCYFCCWESTTHTNWTKSTSTAVLVTLSVCRLTTCYSMILAVFQPRMLRWVRIHRLTLL